MFTLRNLILLLAPVPVLSGSIALSRWAVDDPNRCATRNEVHVGQMWGHEVPERSSLSWRRDELRKECEIVSRQVARRLPSGGSVIVREPFVLAGDLTQSQLDGWHRQTIAPAVESMMRDYFRKPPNHPVTIWMFSDEPIYRQTAARLFGEQRVSIYGFYQPHERTVMVNLGAGGGTLVHELTHVMIDFDCPTIPIWFHEGLASLHEHGDIVMSLHGPEIRPLPNWRLTILQQAIAAGRLMPTRELMRAESLQGDGEAVMYAHARFFCFFLAERGRLAETYARLRCQSTRPPGGQAFDLIEQAFKGKSSAAIDREFRQWVMEISPPDDRHADTVGE